MFSERQYMQQLDHVYGEQMCLDRVELSVLFGQVSNQAICQFLVLP